VVQASTISEYDLGGAGDLFKAPEAVIEEPITRLDPMTAAISMISGPEDVISSQGLKASDIVSLQSEPLLSEVFYECKKDLLAKGAIGASIAEVMEMKVPLMSIDENQSQENNLTAQLPFPKCVSSGSLSSISGLKPSFLDFAEVDFRDGTLSGMRRAYSEGEIKVEFDFFVVFMSFSQWNTLIYSLVIDVTISHYMFFMHFYLGELEKVCSHHNN